MAIFSASPSGPGRAVRPFAWVTACFFSRKTAPRPSIRFARGWRYITLQIADIDAVHAELRSKGVREGLAPITLGDVARISMILDPDGNWIELSRRTSIVGGLS
jgi:catechol 2,3-dioxygenase-like lactoylglutathione lyase family enzyme